MSKTRVRYDFARSSCKRVAVHRLTWRERLVRWYWKWAERYCS